MNVRRLPDVRVTRATYEAWKKFAEGPHPRKGRLTLAPIPPSWRVYRFRIVPDDRPLDLSFLRRS